MPSFLDLERWKRRAHFEFYRRFDNPYFNICAPVDVSGARGRASAAGGPSFSLLCLHAALCAANDEECFRYRLRGERVLIHPVLHGGSTVLRDDETFGFAYFDFDRDFERFAAAAAPRLAEARGGGGLEPRDDDALCHFSILPWIAFTSFSNARCWGSSDSVPKIVFGRASAGEGGRWTMPVSVEVHHALVDGLHVARFFAALEGALAGASSAVKGG